MTDAAGPLDRLWAVTDTPARVVGRDSAPVDYAAAEADAAAGTEAHQAAVLESLAHAATLPRADDHPGGCALCQRCEVLPAPLAGPGTLRLAMPHTHTLGKVLAWAAHSGLPHARSGGTLAVEVGPPGPGPALAAVAAALTASERRDARAFFQPAGRPLLEADYFRVQPLDDLVAALDAGWLLDLLRGDRLVSFFQPIVRADGAEVHAYECLMRGDGDDGGLVLPGAILDAARRADLVFQVDMAARRAAIAAAVAHGVTAAKVFVNFSPNAIYDPTHCLDSTVRMVDAGGLERGNVVFEVTEAERLPDLPHLVRILNYYRDGGFGVALDDVGAGYASLQVLLGLRPDYVKLDMSLVRGVDADPRKAVLAGKLIEACRDLGLRTVAEGVETEAEWDWVRGRGVDFAQGYLFARPARVPLPVAPRAPALAAS